MSTIIICDMCGEQIGGSPVTIALPSEEDWAVIDLCSRACVLGALGMDEEQDEEDGQISRVLDDLPPRLAEEVEEMQEEPRRIVLRPSELSNDERDDNEKKFKEAAERATGQMLGVRNRSKGER